MHVTLNVDQPILNWDGTPALIQEREGEPATVPLTLRFVLLRYLSAGEQMGLTLPEQYLAYDAGRLIARGGMVALEEGQWDVLKRLCAEAKTIFPLPVKVQAKRLVDGATMPIEST